jgi:hypothetical protein
LEDEDRTPAGSKERRIIKWPVLSLIDHRHRKIILSNKIGQLAVYIESVSYE